MKQLMHVRDHQLERQVRLRLAQPHLMKRLLGFQIMVVA
jgi:hypothetical protein